MFNFDQIKEEATNLLLKMSFVDRNGIEFKFEHIVNCNPERVLNIRNNKLVREMMNNSNIISLEEHLKFISDYKKLERSDFIILDKSSSEYVGSINFKKNKDQIEIGKYIGNTDYLKRGIAYESVNCMLRVLKNIKNRPKVFAKTKVNNFRNISLNESLGLKNIHDEGDGFIRMELE